MIPEKLRGRYAVQGDPLRSERRLELVAVMLLVLLCLQLIYSGVKLALAVGPAPIAPAADALSMDDLQRAREVVAAQSSEIRNRPLFWRSRRPSEALPEGSELDSEVDSDRAEVGELKGVRLKGIFGSGDTAGIIALVKDKKQRILIGEQLNGWTLHSVSPNRVVLVDGGREQELLLKTGVVFAAKPVPAESSRGSAGAAPATKEQQKVEATKEPGSFIVPPSPVGIKR